MSWKERAAQLAVVALAIGSVAAIGKLADPVHADAPPLSPRPAPRPPPEPVHGSAPGVAIRLVDRLPSAVVDAPELAEVDKELAYWRRMRSPYSAPSGEVGRAVQQVSLVRSAGKQTKQALGKTVWIPDPKVWNMTEGTFDQREAILAPPPATLRFPSLPIPAGAVLEVAPAIAGQGMGGVDFEVAVRVPGGERVVLGKRFVAGGHTGSFADWHLSLEEYAGKSLELELTTRARVKGVEPAAAYWGTPNVLGASASELPFNVLFIVVDSLRGDALSSAHDDETDAKMAAAKPPPLEAWLPRLPEVAPRIDALAKQGVHFVRAYSGGTWTRPGTLAMLAGTLSSDLGLSALPLVPAPADVRALYAKRPPFLPLLLRPRGALCRAIVNNFYMVGYSGVGVDMGFEGLIDHRYNRDDTAEIVRDTMRLLEQHRARRFFFFVNLNSPHSPYQPPPAAKAAIPRPPRGPEDRMLRSYLAEIHKDDAAVGELLAKLDELGLSEDTLVLLTADHGETLSREHEAIPDGVDGGPRIGGRFHHLSSLYDETAHVPLILRLPKKLPAGLRVKDPVSSIDIVPTLLELAGIDAPSSLRGSSLLHMVRGKPDPERPIVVEGRGAHSIRVGRWRLVIRDPAYRHVRVKGRRKSRPLELYDLESDPGERVEVTKQHPEVVARLLEADRKRSAQSAAASTTKPPKYHLYFAGGSGLHRLKGRIRALGADGGPATVVALGNELAEGALRSEAGRVELDLSLVPEGVLAFELAVDPPNAELEWELRLDDAPWPAEKIFAGSFGLEAKMLATGVRGESARRSVAGATLPFIDAAADVGLYVIRDTGPRELELAQGDAAKAEAMGLMKAWGYVR